MLYRIIIDNYRSFGETVQFDMFPNPKREILGEHVYSDGQVPLLKMAALYGSNGAGKSNLVKALLFLKSLCTMPEFGREKHRYKDWYQKNRFSLPVREDDAPISFMMEFSTRSRVFIYHVEIGAQGILREELLLSGLGKEANKPVFRRNGSEIQFFSDVTIPDAIIELFVRQLRALPGSSALAINGALHFIDNGLMQHVYKWMRDDLIILDENRPIPTLIDMLLKDKKLLAYAGKIMTHIDLGVEDMRIENRPFDAWIDQLDEGERAFVLGQPIPAGENGSLIKLDAGKPLISIHEDAGKKIVSEIMFRQLGTNGFVGDMDIQAQSDGTIRMLNLIPALYAAYQRNACVIVDELDRGIHPQLIKELIRYFGLQTTHGQLIFTTHEEYLLNQRELLRPDEVWIVDKNEGKSVVYSLNSFKIHNTISIQNGYMEGRYGGVPKIALNHEE